ncbi:DNA helicase [Tanacetum coccineum]
MQTATAGAAGVGSHVGSPSAIAPVNHAYLCLNVTDCIIRPAIIPFVNSRLENAYQSHARGDNSDTIDLMSPDNEVPVSGECSTSVTERIVESSCLRSATSNTSSSSRYASRRSLAHERTVSYIDLGDCNQQCRHCGCLFWYNERLKSNNYGRRAEYHLCCGGGKIYMPPTPDPPLFVQQLLTNAHFMEHIRAYNQMFAMTSFGAKVDNSVNMGRGPYVFKVSGQIYHWIGSLCPEEGDHPRFLQLYIHDTHAEVANRLRNFGHQNEDTLNPEIVEGLIHVLDEHNGLVRLFRTARDRYNAGEIPSFKIRLYNKGGARGYEFPTSDVLGGIVFEDGPKSRTDFDVIVEFRAGHPQRINKLHQSYMSLQFPLLFVFGEPGFYPELLLKPRDGSGRGKKVTMNAYYKYQLHPRVKGFGLIFRCGRLFQQYVVTAFCAVEQSRLDFIRKRQNDLRSDYLLGLYDAISQGDREGIQAGSMVMLPRTFTGGPRYMYSHYLDALAICRSLGNPQFFITFTCNVKWPEIKRYMSQYPGLTATDRADIVCRVFEQKVNDFISFLKYERPFGYVIAFLYTIEFQKRGLPHCHTLLWVDSSSKIHDASQIDDYISAELPDPVEDLEGYKVVSSGRTLTLLGLDRKKTTLTEWYVYNNEHTDGRHLTYLDFPSEFVWYSDSKKLGTEGMVRTRKSLGRLTYVHPNSGDLFYFRMLLSHQKGCKSPIEVRTVNGQILLTYRAACEALGLLSDDREWDIALEESGVSASSAQLRTLFAQILEFGVTYLLQSVCLLLLLHLFSILSSQLHVSNSQHNVKWPEIKRYMSQYPGLTATDRADIVCRVFEQKVNDFISFLKYERPFGYVIAFLYTIEFQKRGLPHCHTLLWVDSSSKIHDASQIDDYISAELPDPVEDPEGYKVVSKLMMHGPCGVANPSASCTEKGICNKHFPKMYNDKTFFDTNGHTHYRRRQTQVHVMKGESRLDNCNVVPYNRVLCLAFRAHINVEYCGWSMLIKYLFKYISKGPDRILGKIEKSVEDASTSTSERHIQVDEIQNYVDGRFICPFEACWRIFEYPIHRREPAVQILNVHLENMQRVNFRERDRLDVIVNLPDRKKTTLTEWYTRKAGTEGWRTRKSLGRLTYVHPNSGDLFYFRMLLSHQKGCKSPIEVRTVNGQVLPTYRAACEALGLLGDDREWDIALEESGVSASSAQLRTLFAQILVYCDVSDPPKLWRKHWEAMQDDIPAKISEATGIVSYHVNTPELQDHILYELETILNGFGKSVKEFGLPSPSERLLKDLKNKLLMEEKNYKRDTLMQETALLVPKLNEDQKEIYDLIINASQESRQELLFVYGHGGTGKTFLWKTIISSLRSQGKIVLYVPQPFIPMSVTAIASLKVGQEDCIIEAKVYRKWISKSIPDMKEQAFCCILIDRENTAVQANMDLKNLNQFDQMLKLKTVYRISNFICENTKPYQQTLGNKISLKFGKITSFQVLPGKESEFPEHHFEFISYNQLSSRVPYRDKQDSKMIYPILTDYLGRVRSISDITPFQDATGRQKYRRKVDIESLDGNVVEFTMWDDLATQFNKEEIEKLPPPIIIVVSSCRVTKYRDVQLSATPATYYYINPKNQEAENAYKMFEDKYSLNPPLQVTKYRYDDPEQEKTRNRQTLYALLQQNPTTFKGVRFTCEAMITSLNSNRSWSYASCSQCSKASTKRNGVNTCEDHGEQEPPTYRYNFKVTAADGTATAEFTFFTAAGQKIIGHPCSYLKQKYEPTDTSQLPVEMVNTIGEKHIFQIEFDPSTQKGAGVFI